MNKVWIWALVGALAAVTVIIAVLSLVALDMEHQYEHGEVAPLTIAPVDAAAQVETRPHIVKARDGMLACFKKAGLPATSSIDFMDRYLSPSAKPDPSAQAEAARRQDIHDRCKAPYDEAFYWAINDFTAASPRVQPSPTP